MRKPHPPLLRLAALGLAFAAFCATASAQRLQYPVTKKVEQIDTYFGVKVADPYRWLEQENAPETARWVDEQNQLTFGYLESIPYRRQVRDRLEKLYNYAKYGPPFRRGQYYFFFKNDGLQNQSVLYAQEGLDGAPAVLLDPNKFSADGTSQLASFGFSKEGRYLAYGISEAGSDWQEIHVLDVAQRKTLPDVLKWFKSSNIAWQGDGFYYSRFDEPAKGKELTSTNENHRVYYHRVGTPQSRDEPVYEDAANPQRIHRAATTEDERYVILYVFDRSKGKKGNALFFRDSSKGKTFLPIVPEVGDDTYTVVGNVGDKFLLQTNRGAPNWRVVRYDPARPNEKSWKQIVPEAPEPLQAVSTGGGKLFAVYLKDVVTRAYVYDLGGKLENEVALPAPGIAGGFGGLKDDKSVFYTFSTFNLPPTVYRYDIASRRSSVFRASEIQNFRPSDYEVRQVFCTSKDGTHVPLFVVHRKGLKLDGRNPTLLYGYGGFSVATTPSFSSLRLALLEQGFVYVSANVRGGGEYGERWHEQGAKLKKQNVFDDFIAAAEWLIANKYTSPERLAIHGVSNGGLLVGAVANQRPDLFKVVIEQAGVLDMLRFHKFTIGRNWISDYGSSDTEAEFKALYAYSPVHNVRAGVKYPATLITTADHDDRVVSAHSFKYAATLQERQAGDNPVLIRVETKSGHGASSTAKAIEQATDIYSFLFRNLGVAPKYAP
ncbi:MAG: prolyl oligopeptidase [Acidobacteriota bacterium]|jgi:prolyl oligopeptidase|nr:prolyl oligopeptidase [Acidobacteriota bacterium]